MSSETDVTTPYPTTYLITNDTPLHFASGDTTPYPVANGTTHDLITDDTTSYSERDDTKPSEIDDTTKGTTPYSVIDDTTEGTTPFSVIDDTTESTTPFSVIMTYGSTTKSVTDGNTTYSGTNDTTPYLASDDTTLYTRTYDTTPATDDTVHFTATNDTLTYDTPVADFTTPSSDKTTTSLMTHDTAPPTSPDHIGIIPESDVMNTTESSDIALPSEVISKLPSDTDTSTFRSVIETATVATDAHPPAATKGTGVAIAPPAIAISDDLTTTLTSDFLQRTRSVIRVVQLRVIRRPVALIPPRYRVMLARQYPTRRPLHRPLTRAPPLQVPLTTRRPGVPLFTR
nr:mucin-5AC-like [Penaeus vannamei]